MKESTREEFLTLAMQKRNAPGSGQVWVNIVKKLLSASQNLDSTESDALRHEALKKIAYLKEQRERGRESSVIKLRLLEEACVDQSWELPK
jgi:hypothetical protein